MKGIWHNHSTYSYDGQSTLDELAEFGRSKGLDFIAMTEHADFFTEDMMRAFVEDCRRISRQGLILIPGLEFGFEEYPLLHLLGVGLTQFIPQMEISATIDAIHAQGGLAVIAHPSRNQHYVPEHVIERLDGIEIWNATYDSRFLPHHGSLTLFARLKAQNPRLLAFGGLDTHFLLPYRDLTLDLQSTPRTADEIVDTLRAGRFVIQGRYLRFSPSNPSGAGVIQLVRLGRILLRGADTGLRMLGRRARRRSRSRGTAAS